MGWDGFAIFEEQIGGHWLPLDSVEIQALTYRAADATSAPFISKDDVGQEDLLAGRFLWEDFVEASDSGDIGSYRALEEAVDQVFKRGKEQLAMALIDDSRKIRVFVDVCH